MTPTSNRAIGLWVRLALALVLLNEAVAFTNVWPTPGIRWSSDISLELAATVLLMALVRQLRGPLSTRLVGCLAAIWVVLALGRYADVTSQGLFGRPINLYWDMRHLPAVGQMFAYIANPWMLLGVLLAVVIVPLAVYLPVRWAITQVRDGLEPRAGRVVLGGLAAVLLGLAIVLPPPEDYTTRALAFARPVTATYDRQVRLLIEGLTGADVRALPEQPSLDSDLSRIRGADVLLIFMESYGAMTWDHPEAESVLAPSRARLEASIADTNRAVVSGLVESPTFGGGSWLAHISFLSGLEIRDDDMNQRLMRQQRPTIVTTFRQRGYRTIALMPGMSQPWPEGAFYGFTDIFDYYRLDYKGPSFGWWDVPDQFSMHRLDTLALGPEPRDPVFVFFPTVSTHAPFIPTPPYQDDWSRLSSDTPFGDAEVAAAYDQTPDWLNLEPGYLQSVAYAYDAFGGYLRHRADRDLVMILIGDHQPPALVTGPGATWHVPVHVIASHPDVLERLTTRGFRAGLAPGTPSMMKMNELPRVLLDAFGS